MSSEASAMNMELVEDGGEGRSAAVVKSIKLVHPYPKLRALSTMIEGWMLYVTVFSVIAAKAVQYYYPFSYIWLLAIPILLLAALVGLRAKRNVKRLRERAEAYADSLRRAERYRALLAPARKAVDELRQDIRAILESTALRGDQFTQILSKLDEWGNDYVDLLFLFQVRAARLKSIEGRDIEGTRRAIASDRERAASNQRLLSVLKKQEELVERQQRVGVELSSSLELIKQQARNIRQMVTLVSDQVSSLPLGVTWTSATADFEQLSDTIHMTKEMLSAVHEDF